MNYTHSHSNIISTDGFLTREEVHVTVKLKRCPFCGGIAATQHGSSDDIQDTIFIECQTCGNMSGDYSTHEEAAKAWNRRAK